MDFMFGLFDGEMHADQHVFEIHPFCSSYINNVFLFIAVYYSVYSRYATINLSIFLINLWLDFFGIVNKTFINIQL